MFHIRLASRSSHRAFCPATRDPSDPVTGPVRVLVTPRERGTLTPVRSRLSAGHTPPQGDGLAGRAGSNGHLAIGGGFSARPLRYLWSRPGVCPSRFATLAQR
ncbi:MAG: hypothetical protein AMXMBFR58_38020 [Phycisphaerae bacterium]